MPLTSVTNGYPAANGQETDKKPAGNRQESGKKPAQDTVKIPSMLQECHSLADSAAVLYPFVKGDEAYTGYAVRLMRG
jgi:hypothetical protein